MKHILTFGLLLASVFSWIVLVGTDVSGSQGLQKALAEAKKYEQEELYIKAIENYRTAVSLTEDNYAYKIAMIEDYEKLGDMESAISLSETLVSTNPNQPDSYIRLLKYYKEEEMYTKFVPMVLRAAEAFPEQKEIHAYAEELEKMHEVDTVGYAGVTAYYNGQVLAYSNTLDEERPRESMVLDEAGNVVGESMFYKDVKFTDVQGQFLVKVSDSEWQIINEEGYPVARCKDGVPEEFGIVAEGCVSAKDGSNYILLNNSLAKSKMKWDYAGTFSGGVAPIQIGKSWGLMTKEHIAADASMCKYEGIAVDEFGRCCVNDRIFIKQQGKYYLVNAKGEKVSDAGFEDAKAFVSNQPAAVKQGGKWGFLSADGEMVIKPQFEDAQSFSNAYAAVKEGDKWGIINAKGTIVVEPSFTQVKDASSRGVIPVLDDTGYWNLLKMYKLYYYKS